MKKMIWLLLSVNIGLVIYFNLHYLIPATPPVLGVEIHPEKMQIVSPSQMTALPKKQSVTTTVSAPPPQACFEWGLFSATNTEHAKNAVTTLGLEPTVKEYTYATAKRYWVYKPPAKSAQDAQLAVAELKASGINDLFVVQEPKWTNAISFGIFSDEQLANKLLYELKAKGVKNVIKVLRSPGPNHASLIFNNITVAQAAELAKLKPEFPEGELKEIACN